MGVSWGSWQDWRIPLKPTATPSRTILSVYSQIQRNFLVNAFHTSAHKPGCFSITDLSLCSLCGEKLKRDVLLKKKKSIKQDLQRHLRSGPYYPKYLRGFDQPINSQAEQTGAIQPSNKNIFSLCWFWIKLPVAFEQELLLISYSINCIVILH